MAVISYEWRSVLAGAYLGRHLATPAQHARGVIHVIVLAPFKVGRIKRAAGDVLCRRIDPDRLSDEPEGTEGHALCPACESLLASIISQPEPGTEPKKKPSGKGGAEPTVEVITPGEYRKALDTQRSQLVRIAENRGVDRLKTLYDAAQDELESKLRRIPGGRKETMTAYQQQLLSAQVRQGQAVIAKRMAGEMGDITREAQVDSLRGLDDWMGKMEAEYTGAEVALPIEEASRFWGVVDKRRTSLLAQHAKSMSAYGASVVGAIEKELALSLATGETLDGAVERVRSVADTEFWKAERIARTEQAWAFNATHADGIKEIAAEFDDLYMRWTEHVFDSGLPMDDRVGADSIAMHGQVTRPGDMFVMPDDPDVSESLQGMAWEFPPNRPNDRAILNAWRPHWGGLAWTYQGGTKIFLSR